MPNHYNDLWKAQLRICELNVAQLIRLFQWSQDGVEMDDQEMLVDEGERLNSLQRQKEKQKQSILSLDKQIRIEKERERRTREMNASRKKKT